MPLFEHDLVQKVRQRSTSNLSDFDVENICVKLQHDACNS